MADYPSLDPPRPDPVRAFHDAVLAALGALPNPRLTSGMWRRGDWEQGRTDAVEAVTAVLAEHLSTR